MKKLALMASVLGALVTVAPASAQVIFDFAPPATHSGTCTVTTTTASCTDVTIISLQVENDGTAADGSYFVDSGTLSFSVSTTSPATDSFSITGSVDCTNNVAIGTSGTVCSSAQDTLGTQLVASGTTLLQTSGALTVTINSGTSPQSVDIAGGSNTISSALLTALGVSTPPGWTLAPPTAIDISGGQAYSFDISDVAVPEPTSVVFLGTILFGVTGLIRKRAKKA